MADSRLELLRRSYAAYAAGDADAAVEVWHPECEWDMGLNAAATSEPVFRGHDGIRTFITETSSTADVQADILEVRGDGDRLLIRGMNRFHMRAYEVDLTNQPFGQVCEFKDGLILRVTQTDDPPPGWEDAEPVE